MTATAATNGDARPPPRNKPSCARERRETLFLAFVLAFVLNCFNGKKIMQSLRFRQDLPPPPPPPEVPAERTAVIISSSWIPSLPSTEKVDVVLNSTGHLLGLSPAAPVFITVDHFRFRDFDGLNPALKERIRTLEEYTVNLYDRYLLDPRVHVIPAVRHLHIGGSVLKALGLIARHYPAVRYVYYLQHDFAFFRDVDHAALVAAMDARPDEVHYVRFPKRNAWHYRRECGDRPPVWYNGTTGGAADGATATATAPARLVLHPTDEYSDNNHLARLDWYRDALASLVKLDRAPENPLQKRAFNGCRGWRDAIHGLYLYHAIAIVHMDGRQGAAVR